MSSTAIKANGSAVPRRAAIATAAPPLKAAPDAAAVAAVAAHALSPAAHKQPQPVSASKSWEIPRKIFHSSIAPIVLMLHLRGTPVGAINNFLAWFLALVVSTDALRLNAAWFERAYEAVVGPFMRESEKTQVNGVMWYLVGCLSVLHFLPADVACVSIFVLSWCDTAASVCGRLWGRYTPKLPNPPFAQRKSLAGSLAACLVGAIIAFGFWGTTLAAAGERGDGLTWASERPAVLGTPNAPGPFGTGWGGLAHGVSNRAWWLSPPYSLMPADKVPAKPGLASLEAPAEAWTPLSAAPAMPLPVLALLTGIAAACSEAVDIGGLDDNLTVPVLTGASLYAIFFVWGHLSAALWA